MTDFYHDQQRELLIYPRLSDRILANVPEAKAFDKYVAVPRTLHNSQILRLLGHNVAPIITDANYDWPIEPGRKPLAHQKVYANFQVLNPRCFNLGDPGTMKTLSSLWAADYLMRIHPKGTFRALIICPLTIIESGWGKAIFRNFLGRRTFEILHGSPEKRLAKLNQKADFYLINYEGVGVGAHTRKRFELDGFSKALAERNDIPLVIIDEARAYGDATSLRSRIAKLVIGKKTYMWAITGSPTPQKPTDCYGIAKLLNNAFGKSFRSFQDETMIKVGPFIWVPRKEGYEQARKILVPAIRYALDEIWDGPEQTIQPWKVELTPEQKKAMADLKRDLQVVAQSGKLITANNEAAARQKFLQISMGAIYDEKHNVHLIDSRPRIHALETIINSTQRKVVIFCPLTSVINMLFKHLSKTWKCAIINGEVAVAKRPAILRAFENDPEFKVVIADPTATSHGINEFVAADTGVWYSAVDKADQWDQGNKRIRRPGQKWPSTIFQLFATATEEEIFRRLQTSTSLQGVMLDAIQKGEF